MRSVARTHVGLRRAHNEDSFFVDDARSLYAVADGMGGHAAGEVASGLCVQVLGKIPNAVRAARMIDTHALLHRVLLRNMEKHPERAGMGTTLSMVLADGPNLLLAHAGDSAAFLVRDDGTAQRLTEDQSSGHALHNCLGVSRETFQGAQYVEISLQLGDRIVLCTDGLTNYLPDPQVLATLSQGRSLSDFAQALIDHALRGGGQDNVTVVCLEVNE